MLPTFQIRGLRFCAVDCPDASDDGDSSLDSFKLSGYGTTGGGTDTIAPDHSVNIELEPQGKTGGKVKGKKKVTEKEEDGPWADIQLRKRNEYDDLLQRHPEAALAYVDEDDGDMITVGSSHELFTRIEELKPQTPIIFDLQNLSGLPIWRKEMHKIHRRQRHRSPDTTIASILEAPALVSAESVVKGPLVDLTTDDASSNVKEGGQEKPFWRMFENELSRLMGGASDLEEVSVGAPASTIHGSAPQLFEKDPPIELSASTPGGSSGSQEGSAHHSHPFAQLIAGFPFTSLCTSIMSLAETSASAARAAAALSRDIHVAEFESGVKSVHRLLDTAAREAASAAAQAAEATRSIDVSEFQKLVGTVSSTVKEVGEVYQHVGQVVGGEVKRAMREAVERKGRASESMSREEREVEKAALEKAIREFQDDTAGCHRQSEEKNPGKGKERAIEETSKRTAPPRPSIEEVVDEEAPGITMATIPSLFTREKETTVNPNLSSKLDSSDIPHVQSPSPPHTSTPPPVPKKTPINVSDNERKTWTIHAPEHDDEGDSSDSSEDAEEHHVPDFPPRMHGLPGHSNTHPSSPYGQPHYVHPAQSFHPYALPCRALRGVPRVRDMPPRGLEAVRVLPRDDEFPVNASSPEVLRHRMSCPVFSPVFQQPPTPHSSGPSMSHLSPHTSMSDMQSSFPGVRTSPPRIPPIPHQTPPQGFWKHPTLGPHHFSSDSQFCPLEHSHAGMPPFMTPPPPPPPPPPPFAPQPPHHEMPPYPFPPPPPSWMGNMGMYSRFVPAYRAPSHTQQAYNSAIKHALSNIPMPSLQDQLQNPGLCRRLWDEIDRVASEVQVPTGVVGWQGMPLEEMVKLRLEAGEEAILRARRVGEEGIDHRDVRLEVEDDEEEEEEEEEEENRHMSIPMENPFATPPRMESPVHMSHYSRPASVHGVHLPTYPPSRPTSAARMFSNFRPSPMPITSASPGPLGSPFVRHGSPLVTRSQGRRASGGSLHSANIGNGVYASHMSAHVAVGSGHGNARTSPPANPLGVYTQPSAPAIPIDHRNMPSAPAVPGDDTDAFEMSSPLLPHLPPIRSSTLHNLHRGTPPVPEVPEDDGTDQGSRRPQSPFLNHSHHSFLPQFPPHGTTYPRSTPPPPPPPPPQPPIPPVQSTVWSPLSGLPRANTFPAAFPPPQPPQPPQSQIPASFPAHLGAFSRSYGSGPESVGTGSRNPFVKSEGAMGMQGMRHESNNGYIPPAAFWPADVDEDDEDDDEHAYRKPMSNRERAFADYSVFSDDGFSTRSEEERRGRSPTARSPRAQPGNYTPPAPPRFKVDQHLRELMKENVEGTTDEKIEQKIRQGHAGETRHGEEVGMGGGEKGSSKRKEECGRLWEEIAQKRAQGPEHEGTYSRVVVEAAEPLRQPQEQHEPSVPSTPVPPVPPKATVEFLNQLERELEIITLPPALPPPQLKHTLGTVGEQLIPRVSTDIGGDFQASVPPVPAPFSYPVSPPPQVRYTPRLDLRCVDPNLRADGALPVGPTLTSNEAQSQPEHPVQALLADINSGSMIPSTANENTNLTLSLRRPSLDVRIDQCIAQLIEMGFADDGKGDEALDMLRVYATHAEGDVQTAVELLEEDIGAWKTRQDSERDRDPFGMGGNGSRGNGEEGWRLAGWY